MSFADPEFMESYQNEREITYEAPDFEKSRENKNKKLKNEVRKISQSIHSHKPLDADWKKMCYDLRRLSEIAFEDEHPDTEQEQNEEHKVKGKDSEQTLWDEEQTQSVVRILLEEGKLNLLLRLLSNFKGMQQREDFKVAMEIQCNRRKMRMSSLQQLCSIYEHSLGVLLFFCISRIESLQILDSEHLVEHIESMLTRREQSTLFRSRKGGDGQKQGGDRMLAFAAQLFSDDKGQECLALYYLYLLSTYFCKLQHEEKLMGHVEKYGIVPKSVAYVMRHHAVLSLDVLQKYCLFLSHCFETESFSAEPDAFLVDDSGKKETLRALCQFYELYALRFVKEDKVLTNKQMRAYMKQHLRFKRQIQNE